MGLYGSPELYPYENQFDEKDLITCKSCGREYSKLRKRCPNCGRKTKRFYRKWQFWLVVILIGVAIFYVKENTVNEEEYKPLCQSISYDEVSKSAESYIGENIFFEGQVYQVLESGNTVTVLLEVTKGSFGVWYDTVYVEYNKLFNMEKQFFEGDIITVYGTFEGIKTYTSVWNTQVSVPFMKAKCIDQGERD